MQDVPEQIDPAPISPLVVRGTAHAITFLKWLATRDAEKMRQISNEELQWRAKAILREIAQEVTTNAL